MRVTDNYSIYYKENCIGVYLWFSSGKKSYSAVRYELPCLKEKGVPKELTKDFDGPLPYLEALMQKENRAGNTRHIVYISGDITIKRTPYETGESFIVYDMNAKRGAEGYSEKRYVTVHAEGGRETEDMNEWVSWYRFNKMDDGTYEAELDEAWFWGGGHNDGGTIHTEIPEEWFCLPYDDFLEKVVTLSRAAHYGFTADELRKRDGLRDFFGF